MAGASTTEEGSAEGDAFGDLPACMSELLSQTGTLLGANQVATDPSEQSAEEQTPLAPKDVLVSNNQVDQVEPEARQKRSRFLNRLRRRTGRSEHSDGYSGGSSEGLEKRSGVVLLNVSARVSYGS